MHAGQVYTEQELGMFKDREQEQNIWALFVVFIGLFVGVTLIAYFGG